MQHFCLTDHVPGSAETLCGHAETPLCALHGNQTGYQAPSLGSTWHLLHPDSWGMHGQMPKLPSSNLNLKKHLLISSIEHQKRLSVYLPALQDLATSGVDMVEIKFQKSFCHSVIAWRNRANLKASPLRLHQISRVILRSAPCAARTASDSLLMQISSSCESNKISLQTLMAPSSTSTLQRVSWILEQQERPGWGMK